MDIVSDNQFHLSRFKILPPNPSYISGFIDGDGCIFIRKLKNGYQSGISISQSRTNILQVIRYHFGGSITSNSNRNNQNPNIKENDEQEIYDKNNKRNQYNLVIRNNEYNYLLDYLNNTFVIKECQYQCVKKFRKFANLKDTDDIKNELHMICSDANITHQFNQDNLERINVEYIAGLFDAEGCLFISNDLKKIRISISQKNNPSVLDYIATFLGYGKVNNIRYDIYKKSDCLSFLNLIDQHLIVKYTQAINFKKYLMTYDVSVKYEIYRICNKEKHENELYNNLNKNDNGKEGYVEIMRLKKIKEDICREIQKNQIYKNKSEKMMGEGNHNYRKKFSQETKKKMSLSIREAKGGVSDIIIMEVRQLIKDGYRNVDIQHKLKLPRHTVTRIKNGEIVCRNENVIEHNKLSHEQINLSKRKVSVDDILLIIEKHIEGLKPRVIMNLFGAMDKYNVTIDIIKNIKRSLINGKKIIYESELSTEKYNYYLDLRKQFTDKNI